MCLLILKPAGESIPEKHLFFAADANPHGAGIAWSDGETVQIEKSADWTAADICAAAESLTDYPAIIHFRYATHGSLTDKNTHPFRLPGGWVAGHNGVISGVQCRRDESDTRAFLRTRVSPLIVAGQRLTDFAVLNGITAEIGAGNKMAFLHSDGSTAIANEKAGHWKNGVWYSNASYEPYEPFKTSWSRRKADFFDISQIECLYCGCHIKSRFAMDSERDGFLCEACAEIMPDCFY